MDPVWGRQTFDYKKEEPLRPAESKTATDTMSPRLAALEGELLGIKQELHALKQRKTGTTTVINQSNQGGTKTTTTTPRAAPAPMLFVSHTVEQETASPASTVPEYILAPGTFLPCAVETAMNSEVPGYFTAKVNQNVYDTATRQHVLVPQGSTIVGHNQSGSLVYGNERMDTVSLTLTRPDGGSVDLGRAPVTDQEGVAGLTGRVNNHWWRLFGAVFIGGALRGGMQALQLEMAGAAGAGQVAAGISSVGNQVVTQRLGRALDTRPTIEVDAGQLCNVLLTKPLHLPAMWQ
jgi:type IV secretion system protein VirB10